MKQLRLNGKFISDNPKIILKRITEEEKILIERIRSVDSSIQSDVIKNLHKVVKSYGRLFYS